MKEFILSPAGLLLCWLLLINIASFLTFGVDKWKSKRQGARRIPERNLLLSALAGGSVGALLGMRVFHHKTLHKIFAWGIPCILVLQVVIGFGLYVYFSSVR